MALDDAASAFLGGDGLPGGIHSGVIAAYELERTKGKDAKSGSVGENLGFLPGRLRFAFIR